MQAEEKANMMVKEEYLALCKKPREGQSDVWVTLHGAEITEEQASLAIENIKLGKVHAPEIK